LTPESSIAAQEALGADIMLALDPPSAKPDLARARRWAERSAAARTRGDRALYGVVSDGSVYDELAVASARILSGLPFDGVALSRPSDEVLAELPDRWPRYLAGGGGPAELLAAVEGGIDQLECPAATRLARTGQCFIPDGVLDITLLERRDDGGPIQADCGCYTCATGFARGYLRHLFAANELLGPTLASIHNLWFVQALLTAIRRAIRADALPELKASFLSRYGSA
jgi:queuine tRNA-ribosyltransferase